MGDSEEPQPRTREQMIENFLQACEDAYETMRQMTPREQAEGAWMPHGRYTVDELEDMIREDRGLPPLDRSKSENGIAVAQSEAQIKVVLRACVTCLACEASNDQLHFDASDLGGKQADECWKCGQRFTVQIIGVVLAEMLSTVSEGAS